MAFADSFMDRRALSTDTNEYAYGLNDENEWEENILDYDTPVDEDVDDFLEGVNDQSELYNETGFDRRRVE